MLEPLFHESLMTSTNTWVETLLAALQYSAASHGSRRFLIQPSSPSTIDQGIEAWLFSRALFTTSLTRHWSTLTAHYQPQPRDSVWRGHRLFYRTPPPTGGPASPETEAMETIELPGPVYGWMLEAMEECHASLPPELGKVLPLWNTARSVRILGVLQGAAEMSLRGQRGNVGRECSDGPFRKEGRGDGGGGPREEGGGVERGSVNRTEHLLAAEVHGSKHLPGSRTSIALSRHSLFPL